MLQRVKTKLRRTFRSNWFKLVGSSVPTLVQLFLPSASPLRIFFFPFFPCLFDPSNMPPSSLIIRLSYATGQTLFFEQNKLFPYITTLQCENSSDTVERGNCKLQNTFYSITICTEHSPSWDADSFWASKENPLYITKPGILLPFSQKPPAGYYEVTYSIYFKYFVMNVFYCISKKQLLASKLWFCQMTITP